VICYLIFMFYVVKYCEGVAVLTGDQLVRLAIVSVVEVTVEVFVWFMWRNR